MIDSSTPVLSFPAILRNSGLTGHFAHLQPLPASGEDLKLPTSPKGAKRFREEREGKRWLRRKDNGLDVLAINADH